MQLPGWKNEAITEVASTCTVTESDQMARAVVAQRLPIEEDLSSVNTFLLSLWARSFTFGHILKKNKSIL